MSICDWKLRSSVLYSNIYAYPTYLVVVCLQQQTEIDYDRIVNQTYFRILDTC